MLRAFARTLLSLLPLLWAGSAWGVDPYVAEPAPALAFSELPKYFSAVLDPAGVQLSSTLGNKNSALCDIWWRKQVPAQKASASSQDIAYSGLKPGTFLGVISLFTDREDFQHHMLHPGLYTMRYAQLQQDEDDHAISPFRDFVVLTPSWADKDPEALVPFEELNKRGILASHSDEPAVMSLVPVNPSYKIFPWPVADDRGFCTLQVRLQQRLDGKVSDLPLALIIVRPMYENEGS